MSTAFSIATGPTFVQKRLGASVRSAKKCTPRHGQNLGIRPIRMQSSASPPNLSISLVDLPTGLTMEVIHAVPEAGAGGYQKKRSLILVPGSYHAAWCWKYFQPYFAARGYPSYAISLRGSGLSSTGGNKSAIRLDTHLSDLEALYTHLNLPDLPVLMGHSTGGLLVQQWAASTKNKFSGGVLLASKPPIDHNDLTWRITRKYGLRFAWRITTGFAFKKFPNDLALTREVFFSDKATTPGFDEAIEGDDVLREYMKNFDTLSKLPADLKSTQAPVSSPGDLFGKTLVMGGERDKIVDLEALQETAEFFGVKNQEIFLRDAPHDFMLSSQWRSAADTILNWLDNSLFPVDGAAALGVSQQ